MIKPFILMMTFLTRIPIPMNFEFNPKDFLKGLKLFPFVGAIIGLILMPLFLTVDYVPTFVFPFLVIVLYLMIVGGIHIDGVADVFDGVFSARKPERILVIMEDSRVGTFGVIGLIIYFGGLYVGLYEIMAYEQLPILLVFFPVVGRCFGLMVSGMSKYAKKEGLGKAIVDGTKPIHTLLVAVLLLVVAFLISLAAMLSILITMIVISFLVYRVHRLLGGITGDVVGSMVEISQVVFLISLSIMTMNL